MRAKIDFTHGTHGSVWTHMKLRTPQQSPATCVACWRNRSPSILCLLIYWLETSARRPSDETIGPQE